MSIVEFDVDEAEYIGDEEDGCYVAVGRDDDGWYYTVVVDCNTASFVEDLATDIGPYGTREDALEGGRSCAIDWCLTNGISYD